ncbi:MAG: polysaccharide pyruvyl transferase family protein [Lachnospiraceae bacterium]|nr:polysaccharide pyruvyl transferase family protein [Lachnospiraceae bacterium]
MDKIILRETQKDRNRVIFHYEVTEGLQRFLRTEREFFVEYAFSVMQIPDAILNTVFVCNFLPLVWVTNSEIVVGELDADFVDSLDMIKEGYEFMYQNQTFDGKITLQNKVKISYLPSKESDSLVFYSGGVDATSTLVNTISERPMLFTIWGTDIYLHDVEGWNVVENQNRKAAVEFDLPYTVAKTSFRSVMNYDNLNTEFAKPLHENWWHGFQHGIALLSHAAPIAYYYKKHRIYLGATASAKSSEDYTCASTPIIDNYVRFAGAHCYHEGFENTRDDKIENICRYKHKTGKNIQLRVCWETRTGYNCCLCEKCVRTILEILAAGANPCDYGFDVNEEVYEKIVEKIEAKEISIPIIFWGDSINKLYYNRELQEKNILVRYLVSKYGNRFNENYRKKVNKAFVTYQTEKSISEVKCEEAIEARPIIFRNEKDQSTFERSVQSLGLNTGNMVFLESIKKNLNAIEIPFSEYKNHREKYKNNPVVTTDLIWITKGSNFDYLLEQLNVVGDAPFVPLGVGIQAPFESSKDVKLTDSQIRVLKTISEKNTLGVRGEFTADVLNTYGIYNQEIIGCPSLYYWANPEHKIVKTESNLKKVLVNFRTFYGTLSVKEKHFLTYAADRKYSFVEQTLHRLEQEHCKDERYYEYVNRWMRRNINMFTEIGPWIDFTKDYDFSMGGRFHGNIVALWSRVPALFVSVDSRTEEMLDYFKLPRIQMMEFDRDKSIEYYFEKADYSKFNAGYHEKYKKFEEFIMRNGLPQWGR